MINLIRIAVIGLGALALLVLAPISASTDSGRDIGSFVPTASAGEDIVVKGDTTVPTISVRNRWHGKSRRWRRWHGWGHGWGTLYYPYGYKYRGTHKKCYWDDFHRKFVCYYRAPQMYWKF